MKILGIETSCDETAAAVVESAGQRRLKLLSNVVSSSVDLHKQYGGVVPEIAARSHLEYINPVINQALAEAFFPSKNNPNFYLQGGQSSEIENLWSNIDAVAVTYGPGLGGSLLIGVLTARTLAIVKDKPLYGVNHVQAHVYANFITSAQGPTLSNYVLLKKPPRFPILALIVSGGHTQLVLFADHFNYEVLGRTLDDAAGEAYDKVAKILGLPYPGGPALEKLAAGGNPGAYKLPKPRAPGKYNFSYSGLKTAVLRLAQREIDQDYNFPSHKLAGRLNRKQKADIAAAFNQTAIEMLVDKLVLADKEFSPASVAVGGGVAASPALKEQLRSSLTRPLYFPDPKLCTDNAAMIAAQAFYQIKTGQKPADPKTLEINPSLTM